MKNADGERVDGFGQFEEALRAYVRGNAGQLARLDDSLHVLERQGWVAGTSLPAITAPRAFLRAPRQRRFVPNNSKNWPTERRLNPVKGIDLEPEPLMQWDIEAPCVVWYRWPDVAPFFVPLIRDTPWRHPTRDHRPVGKEPERAANDGCSHRSCPAWAR